MSKEIEVSKDTSYKKSNKMGLSQLNKGLNLTQSQLLAYAIYTIQREGKSSFTRKEFSDMFDRTYNSKTLRKDIEDLFKVHINLEKEDNPDKFVLVSIFRVISYDRGVISFKWEDKIVPHIFDLKNNFILNDLKITMNFKSSHSWVLYDYLKANYGRWYIEISVEEALSIFGVTQNKSYKKNSTMFKRRVLEPAIEDINEHTELSVDSEDIKSGRTLKGFTIRWKKKEVLYLATEKQLKHIKNLEDEILNKATKLFLSLDSQNGILRAKEIMDESKRLIESTRADRFSIDAADKVISEMSMLVRKLDYIHDDSPDKVEFYNWLEDRS